MNQFLTKVATTSQSIEASNKIYDFLHDINVQSHLKKSRDIKNEVITKIFAYTSDLSESAKIDIVDKGKFNDILYSLSDRQF